jgi:tetratricopeptide (TPR) repeat protein
VVISPTAGTSLKMREIRHTYLHYLLDPLAMKSEVEFARLHPLLLEVKSAPMDESFRTNITLLVTECLIRAIELRTGVPKATEAERAQSLTQDDRQGYILTRYFYNALAKFEQNPVGLRNAYEGLLSEIDVNKESKRASQIKFAEEATPEILRQARPQPEHLLLDAERKLAGGDADGAQELAQRALDEKQGDAGRAFFVLAKVATMKRDLDGARTNFGRAIQTSHEPQVIAWSHIYLGRIFDLKEERPEALEEYRTAVVAAGAAVPEARLAAQKGIESPYEPPVTRPPVAQPPDARPPD